MAEHSEIAVTVFPGDNFFYGTGNSIAEADIAKFKDDFSRGELWEINSILPSVTVCIAYKDVQTGKFHHTPYNLYITSLDSNSSPLALMLGQHTIPQGSLSLVRMPNSGPAD
jgi:hypothetical protein